MAYFLSDQFKELVDAKNNIEPDLSTINEKSKKQSSGIYKSEFLHKKIADQNEKKKQERQMMKANR